MSAEENLTEKDVLYGTVKSVSNVARNLQLLPLNRSFAAVSVALRHPERAALFTKRRVNTVETNLRQFIRSIASARTAVLPSM